MFQRKERKDCEVLLRVTGWESEYPSVQRMLRYLKRGTGSDTSRMKYLDELARFLNWHEIGSPEDYLKLGKETATRLCRRRVTPCTTRTRAFTTSTPSSRTSRSSSG